MYTSCANLERGLLVGVFAGRQISDDDYLRSIASIAAADANAVARAMPCGCVLVTDQETPPPPAMWRQRMGEANNVLRSEQLHFTLVSPRLVVRGVFTAINWLTRQRPGHRRQAFAELSQAATWVAAGIGQPAFEVRRLYEQAVRELEAQTAALPRAQAS